MAIDQELSVDVRPKMRDMGDDGGRPLWLRPLVQTTFFLQCEFHPGSHKQECNMYCLDCVDGALCNLCRADHEDHRVIQIRKSSYHNVVRAADIVREIDVSGVQTYTINGAKVFFINERPQPKPTKGLSNSCEACTRSLQENYFRFCSLGCKFNLMSNHPMPVVKTIKIDANAVSEDSLSGSSKGFTPPTPLPTVDAPAAKDMGFRSKERRMKRKGIPRRAPTRTFP